MSEPSEETPAAEPSGPTGSKADPTRAYEKAADSFAALVKDSMLTHVDGLEQTIKSALQRAAIRLQEGISPDPKLPVSKEDFPKMLCLDLNQWIYLAQAHYDPDKNHRAVDALLAIRKAVDSERLIVPFLGYNVGEATDSSDPGRRERLVRFMVDLSGNLSLVMPILLERCEVTSAVLRRVAPSLAEPLRPLILTRGVLPAMAGKEVVVEGGRPNVRRLVNEASKDPEFSVIAMLYVPDDASRESVRRLDQDGLRRLSAIRDIDRHMDIAARRKIEFRNLLLEGSLADLVRHSFSLLDADVEHGRLIADESQMLAFWQDVPSIDVVTTLMFRRDQNAQDKSHRNDSKDFGFLGQAIPYSNIVVTEKRWASLARATKLDTRYQTRVISSLSDLPNLLLQIGC